MDVSYTIHTSAEKTMTIAHSPSVALSSNATAAARSPWHSPVPYLFGGLAAMLGLIAFALLILACSYWRLSGYLEGGSNGERDLEAGEGNPDDGDVKKAKPVFEEKFLVIMPGQQKPTCLATPMSSRSSSFGSPTGSSNSSCSSAFSEKKEESKSYEIRQQIQMGNMDASHESTTNQEDHHQVS